MSTKHFCNYLKERNDTRSQETKDRLLERKTATQGLGNNQSTSRKSPISINTTQTFFSKFFSPNDSESVSLSIPEGTERVVFIDTPATPHLVTTIETLLARGIEVHVRDHHDFPTPSNPREQEIAHTAQKVRDLCGPRAIISNRKEHPSCSTLITKGEFAGPNTVIIADNDADGLTASMKAAGITYDKLDEDAAVLDGPRTEQTADRLSPLALLLVKSMATLPPYNPERPQTLEDARNKLFDEFVTATSGSTPALESLTKKVEAYETGVRVAKEIAHTAFEPVPNVVMVDTTGKERHDLSTLMQQLETRPNCFVTVVRKDNGPIAAKHGGVQMSLAVVKSRQSELNLQDLLTPGFVSSPESGIISNTPFLLHVSESIWESQVLPALQKRFMK